MRKFQIGDEVEVITNDYPITSKGSIGIVQGYIAKRVSVKFHYLSSSMYSNMSIVFGPWEIDEKHLMLVECDRTVTPIISKIRTMYERQPYIQRLKQRGSTTKGVPPLS